MVLVVKNLPANAKDKRDVGSIPGLGKIHCWRTWQPTPVFLPAEPHVQRNLVGCSPQGCKDLDITEAI